MEEISQGRHLEDDPITGYVIEDQVDHSIAEFTGQRDAIGLGKESRTHPAYVARVGHLNDKTTPDH